MRNLNSFGHLQPPPEETFAKQSLHVLSDREMERLDLAELVKMPGWLILKKHFKEYVESKAAPIPSAVSHLIGYATYSIVRDASNELLTQIEREAAAAPTDYDLA